MFIILVKKWNALLKSANGLEVYNKLVLTNQNFKFFLTFIFVFVALAGSATNYYVSASGNDSNNGTSENTAWKSIAKVNSVSFKPGDRILFHCGDTFTGTIKVNNSGTSGSAIVYGSYGTGAKPKIYGSEAITGWTKHSGNIYKATLNSSVNQLFINDSKLKAARHPNNGFLTINSVQSSTQFTCNGLDGGINYTGAKWFGRTRQWTADLKDVTSSSSKTLNLDSAPIYDLGTNEGFILMNKLEFLDSPGEWYYNSSTKTIYLWTPNGDSPTNYIIRGSVYSNGVSVSNKNYVTVQDLNLLQYSIAGVYLSNCRNISIINNEISYPDGYGITDESESQNYLITNNKIIGANHYGMNLRIGYSNITDNEILKTALFDNIGITGTGKANYGAGVRLAGADGNNVFRYNRIIESGYHGIYFAKPKNLIEFNFIKDACLFKGDGGGIYGAWSNHALPGTTGTIVRNNIVLNVYGPKEGYSADKNYGEGIYIDESSEDVIVDNNTVAYCTNSGIFLHDNSGTEVKNNTILDARYGIRLQREHGSNSVHSNTVYALNEDDYLSNQILAIRTSASSSRFNSNKYINHYNSSEIFRNESVSYNFADWKSSSGQDANSTIDLTPLQSGEKEELFYNDTKQVKTINLGTSVYKDINGKQVTGSIKLEPFTSAILIKLNSKSSNQNPIITDQVFEVKGSVQSNEVIGQIEASDPDANQIISYSIIQGNTENLFSVNSSTGELYSNTQTQILVDKSIVLTVEVTDNSGASASANVTINFVAAEIQQTPDTNAPVINSFDIPSTSVSQTIAISNIAATDDNLVAGYLLKETAQTPSASDNNWSAQVPSTFTCTQTGTNVLYLWAKDAAGNISSPLSASTVIVLPNLTSTYSEYLFEENSGINVIDSKGSNNGIISSDASRSIGVNGNGLKLNGSDYINLGNCFGENVINEVTLNTWIQPGTVAGGYQGIIMHGGPNFDSFALYINPNNKSIAFKTSGTTSDWITTTADNLWDGNWHNITATYDGSEKIIYLDGEAILTVAATGSIESGQGFNLLIGAGRDEVPANLLYKGSIDETRIYNYALTLSEIKDLYNYVHNESAAITYNVTEDIEICEGDSYQGWTTNGQYERNLKSSDGKDSIVTTNLLVNPIYKSAENVTIKEGEVYNGWTTSGQYEKTYSSLTGCDSIIVTDSDRATC